MQISLVVTEFLNNENISQEHYLLLAFLERKISEEIFVS